MKLRTALRGSALCLVALVLAALPRPAAAQLGCTIQTQSVLLGQFSDLAAASSITPQNVRNVICSVMNPFSATTPGVVPASGGGTVNFMRADGNWAAPAGGGGASCTGDINAACSIVSKTGGVAFAPSATTDTTNASNISSGTLAAARGGAGTITGALKGNGSGLVSQAACSDLSNASPSCSTDATNASNITSGTLGVARGGTGANLSATGGASQVLKQTTVGGALSVGQLACSDLSNASANCATPVSVTAAQNCIVITPSPGTGTFTVGSKAPRNRQSGVSYTFASTDNCTVVERTNAGAQTDTLPQAINAFGDGFAFVVNVEAAGQDTITPITSTINGASSLVIAGGGTGKGAYIYSDGANWFALLFGGGVTSVSPGPGAATSLTGGQTAITSSGTVYGDASYYPSYLGGCTASNDGTSPNTVIDTAACVVASDDSPTSGAVFMKLAAFTKTTGAWALGTGNGCLDTGSIAQNTWYHVFVIERTDTGVVDELCSLSASAPTFPTNYTKKRRIYSFKTAAASTNILAFTQRGTMFWWAAAVLDVNTSALGTSAVLQTLGSVPTGVTVLPLCRYTFSNAAAAQIILTSPDVTDVAPATANPFTAAPGWDSNQPSTSAAATNSACPLITTNTSGQIRSRSTAATTTLAIVTLGWAETALGTGGAAAGGSGGAGAIALISTQTASSSADLRWTGLVGTNYELQCSNIIPATNAVTPYIQFGEGGTPTWEVASYKWTASGSTTAGGAINNGNSSDSGISNTSIANTGEGWTIKATIQNLSGTVSHTLSGTGFGQTGGGGDINFSFGGFYNGDTNAITGVRVIMSSGNITSGRCSLLSVST